MFELIESMDLFIIEQVEKITHPIQKYTSIDNFNLVYIIAVLLSIYPFYFTNFFIRAIFLFFLFWVFAYIFVIKGVHIIKERVYKDLESGHKNYLLEHELGGRLVSVVFVFICFYYWTYTRYELDNFGLFLILSKYLLACTPLDPGMFNKDTVPDAA